MTVFTQYDLLYYGYILSCLCMMAYLTKNKDQISMGIVFMDKMQDDDKKKNQLDHNTKLAIVFAIKIILSPFVWIILLVKKGN